MIENGEKGCKGVECAYAFCRFHCRFLSVYAEMQSRITKGIWGMISMGFWPHGSQVAGRIAIEEQYGATRDH